MSDSPQENLAATAEQGVWASIDGQWTRLYGDFLNRGVSIEWHDFHAPSGMDWARSFHPDSIEICYNLAGQATLRHRSKSIGLDERTVGLYTPSATLTKAERTAAARHCFITVELGRAYLRDRLGEDLEQLLPEVREFLDGRRPSLLSAGAMNAAQQSLFSLLRKPPVPPAAQRLWYEGKIFEVLAHHLFKPAAEAELFCVRQKRQACERVEQARKILRENLAEPPTLEELGRRVGCGAFHLSRCFSQETGMTIPQYLRQVRIERAAELLLSGKFNVTEAALEVGYSSMSHFSRAFCETTGYCPALYTRMIAVHGKPPPKENL